MTSIDQIEEHIKPLLLTETTFTLEGKKIKVGRLILFCIRDFFCVFTFIDSAKNKRTTYEIPYPFSIEKENNNLIFDYTIEAFSEKNAEIQAQANALQFQKVSKLFNKKLIVTSRI